MTDKNGMAMGQQNKTGKTESGSTSDDPVVMGGTSHTGTSGNQGKVDKVKLTLNFHGSCVEVEQGGSTCVVFGGLIRTKDVVFVYGGNHEDTKCIIASKQDAKELGKKFSKLDPGKQEFWKRSSDFTAKLMGLKEGLEIAQKENKSKKNISVEYNPTYKTFLSLIKKEKLEPGEYVEYVLNSTNGKYEENTINTNKEGILAECRKDYRDLKCKSEATKIEFKVRVNKLDI